MPSSRVRGEMNKAQRTLTTQYKLAIGLRDAMSDAVREDGTLNILGGAGKSQGWVVRTLDNINAATRGIGRAIIVQGADGAETALDGSIGSSQKYADAHPEIFANVDYSAYGIDRVDVRAQARLNAIFIQFAYGKARLNEPGGRISEPDFNHAMTQIAANATDPETLRQVLLGDLTTAEEEYEQWRGQQHVENHDILFQPAADKMYFDAKEQFHQAFGQEFGTANDAGAGLTDPQGDPRADLIPRSPNTGLEQPQRGQGQVTAPAAPDGVPNLGIDVSGMSLEEVNQALEQLNKGM